MMQRIITILLLLSLAQTSIVTAQELVQKGEIKIQPLTGEVPTDANGNPVAAIDVYSAMIDDMSFVSDLIIDKKKVDGVKWRLYVYVPSGSNPKEIMICKQGYMPFHFEIQPGYLIQKKLYSLELEAPNNAPIAQTSVQTSTDETQTNSTPSVNNSIDNNTTITVPVTKPSIDDKNEFYGEPNLRVGALSSIGFSVGGYLNNINMEFTYGVGFGKSDDIYWCDDILWPAKCSYSPKTNLSLKVGYGFALSEKFWITPQTGIYYTRLSCKVDKDFVPPSSSRKFINNASNYATGANCTSLVISARLSADFTDHFGISFTPEWQLGMKKSSGYEKLSDVSSKINKWSKGLNVKFGIVLTF